VKPELIKLGFFDLACFREENEVNKDDGVSLKVKDNCVTWTTFLNKETQPAFRSFTREMFKSQQADQNAELQFDLGFVLTQFLDKKASSIADFI
jgi:hypothetical protein